MAKIKRRVRCRTSAAHPLQGAERTLIVDDGDVLLDVLTANGIAVASLCGGAMACRTCQVVVDSGAVAVSMTRSEQQILDEKAAPAGTRLACQVRVTGDFVVDVPDPRSMSDDREKDLDDV